MWETENALSFDFSDDISSLVQTQRCSRALTIFWRILFPVVVCVQCANVWVDHSLKGLMEQRSRQSTTEQLWLYLVYYYHSKAAWL